jgi:arylsulfatase A-like enzyme
MTLRSIRAAVGWSLWLTAALILNDLARLPLAGLRPAGAREAAAALVAAGLPLYGSAALIFLIFTAALSHLREARRGPSPEAAARILPWIAGAAFSALILAASGSILAGEPGTGRWSGAGLLPGLMATALGALASGWSTARLFRSAQRDGGGGRRAAAIIVLPLLLFALLAAPLVVRAAQRPPARSGSPAGSGHPDILLVVADSLRADALGCCGGSPGVTPALDGLAARGASMTTAMAAAPASAASVGSIMTGRLPSGHGLRWRGGRLAEGALTLAGTLRSQGYRTAAFVSSPVLSAAQDLDRGFDTWNDWHDDRLFARYPTALFSRLRVVAGGRPRSGAPPAAEMVDRALAWLSPSSDRPRFLYLHLDDPREPHQPPARCGAGGDESPSRLPSLDALLRSQVELDDAMLDEMKRHYASDVSAMDREIGRMLGALDGRIAGGGLLVVVTADHGTEFREHGSLGHGHTLYDELIHVPWILARPTSLPAGRVVTEPVSLIDLAPTLVDLAGLPSQESFRGGSLAPLLTGEGSRAAGAGPIVSEMDAIGFHTPSHWSRAARVGDLKVILTSTDVLGLEAWRRETFDLAADPAESAELHGSSPAAEELEEWLRGWMRDHPHGSGAGPAAPDSAGAGGRSDHEG